MEDNMTKTKTMTMTMTKNMRRRRRKNAFLKEEVANRLISNKTSK